MEGHDVGGQPTGCKQGEGSSTIALHTHLLEKGVRPVGSQSWQKHAVCSLIHATPQTYAEQIIRLSLPGDSAAM